MTSCIDVSDESITSIMRIPSPTMTTEAVCFPETSSSTELHYVTSQKLLQ